MFGLGKISTRRAWNVVYRYWDVAGSAITIWNNVGLLG